MRVNARGFEDSKTNCQDHGLEKKKYWSSLTWGQSVILDTFFPKTTKDPNLPLQEQYYF